MAKRKPIDVDERIAAYRDRLYRISATRFARLLRRLLDLAEDEDPWVSIRAIELIMNRLIGSPDKSSVSVTQSIVSPANQVLLASLKDQKMIDVSQKLADMLADKLDDGLKGPGNADRVR